MYVKVNIEVCLTDNTHDGSPHITRKVSVEGDLINKLIEATPVGPKRDKLTVVADKLRQTITDTLL